MAITFTGAEDIPLVGFPIPSATTGTVSFSWWMRPSNIASGTQRIFGSATNMEVRTSASGIIHNDIFESSGDFDSTTALVNGTWYHVVCTGNANTDTAKVYVNGLLEGTYLTATGTTVGTVMTIGLRTGASTADRYQGALDDWRAYSRVLSDAEVATIYAARGHDEIVGGLTARFLFDERAPGVVVSTPKNTTITNISIGTIVGSPVYAESRLTPRRKVA